VNSIEIPAIQIRSLRKEFVRNTANPFVKERLVAVDDVTLSVAPGEVYGLLGPNGSGKSTTMKIVLGLVTPTSGTTAIFGRDSRSVGSRESVGFLPENPYFYKFLSGLETLIFYGRLFGLRGAALRDRARSVLETTGLAAAAARRVGGYSKGMLQRLGLAQALLHEPRLLVLDEPTAGVDPAGSREIRDLILRLKARGVTVLLCSHLLEQVQEICDRIGIMHNGALVREGRLNDLISVEHQTEVVLEDATPAFLENLRASAAAAGVKVVSQRHPQTSLERYFLSVTSTPPNPS
jgi:ABC-2 type transport system ATP-binding protein